MPNLSQDPMEDIKKKLQEEIKAPSKKKVDKEKEKKKQSQSIDYQSSNPGHKSQFCGKNPNTKLGRRAEAAEAAREKPKTQAPDQEFGFRSGSHSQSQISKDENNNEPVFGMFSPKPQTALIKGPEDLYPDQIKQADELSLGDIAQTPQIDDDDLNFNEKDHEIHAAIHYGEKSDAS